jgi:hypothetical protein
MDYRPSFTILMCCVPLVQILLLYSVTAYRNGNTLILGICRDVDEICALLGYYAASCVNYLPTFRDNVSVPSSRVKSPRTLKMGPIRGPETSVNNYHATPRNSPEDRRSNATFLVQSDTIAEPWWLSIRRSNFGRKSAFLCHVRDT